MSYFVFQNYALCCYNGCMAKVDLKEKWRKSPHRPGVYLMKGDGGGIIYVGKAKDLKRRLSNYFAPSAPRSRTAKPAP